MSGEELLLVALLVLWLISTAPWFPQWWICVFKTFKRFKSFKPFRKMLRINDLNFLNEWNVLNKPEPFSGSGC
jgi:hypothetical protein